MFELTEEEIEVVVSQNVIPHKKYPVSAKPFAFTETGVAMLSSVLKSDTAIEMNIAIMRTFISLRKLSVNYKEVMKVLEKMRVREPVPHSPHFSCIYYYWMNPNVRPAASRSPLFSAAFSEI